MELLNMLKSTVTVATAVVTVIAAAAELVEEIADL